MPPGDVRKNPSSPTQPFEVLKLALYRYRIQQTQLVKMLLDRGVSVNKQRLCRAMVGLAFLNTVEKVAISDALGESDKVLFPETDQVGWAIAKLFGITRSDVASL